jgi:hypothetical protein
MRFRTKCNSPRTALAQKISLGHHAYLGGNVTWEGRGESGEPNADGTAVETDSALKPELLSLPAVLIAFADCDGEALAELDAQP